MDTNALAQLRLTYLHIKARDAYASLKNKRADQAEETLSEALDTVAPEKQKRELDESIRVMEDFLCDLADSEFHAG